MNATALRLLAGLALAMDQTRRFQCVDSGQVNEALLNSKTKGEEMLVRPDRAVALGKDAEAMLLAHPWPGNVRELQNVIQRALLKLNGPRLGAAELSGLLPTAAAAERGLSGLVNAMLDGPEPEGGRYQGALESVEKPLIAAAIARTKGNQLRAAELLGMNRNTLRERMRALGMKPR